MNKQPRLLTQTILGFAFLMLVIALALFLPAGSLAFWQAWVYLAVFAGSTILITGYLFRHDPELLARRVRGGPAAETQKSQQIIQSLASLFFIAMFIAPGLDYRFNWSDIPPAASLIADGFVALGFYIVFLVFRGNTYTSATIEVAEEQKVIITGPYRIVRHPMYAGAFLLVMATPLALGSWAAAPLPVPLVLVIILRLLDEEKYLSQNLKGYREYCLNVPYRIIPRVW
ncbi:MAG: isoprenylcysteine carboxylmethyltransferase family protein [Chloroflexi bacterium]|nr:isoprenylcysteine carboxylmethyltransferase family protein [Chloroflexota bacterium]